MLVLELTMACIIRNSRDAYRMRWEKISITFVWSIQMAVVYAYFYTAPASSQSVVPPVLFQFAGQMITLSISNFVPLYYAYKIDCVKKSDSESFDDFVELLEHGNFKEEFYTFLEQQFCGENMQFCEAVQAWKSDPNRKRERALFIYNNFVKESADMQVYLLEESINPVKDWLNNPEYHEPKDHIFDIACDEILHDMYYHSFLLFRATRGYVKAAIERV
jgi:hypothetical protein